jgi:FkbM family methyltransferase
MIPEEEKKALELLLPYLSEKPIIFDVGANKGEWSDVVMDSIPECEVHFFEANIVLVHYLMMKYDRAMNVRIIHRAVHWFAGGEIPFYYFTNENNGLSSIYYNKEWAHLPMQKGTVVTETVDDYAKQCDVKYIDFVKIDVEGAEEDVMIGLLRMLKSNSIKFIQIEYSPHYKVDNRKFDNIIKTVSDLGYSVYLFDGDRYNLVTDFVEDYQLRNYIITKELIADTQDWNSAFKESVKDLPKIDLALEVGCFEGRTTRWIGENMLLPGGRVVCVDPLEDQYLTENLDEAAVKMNAELPYFKNQYLRFVRNTKHITVNLIRKRSVGAYPELAALRFGFIFIDGDHREEAVFNDGMQCLDICRVGGHILFDDYTWSEGTKRGIDRFLEAKRFCIQIIKIDYQVLIKRIE